MRRISYQLCGRVTDERFLNLQMTFLHVKDFLSLPFDILCFVCLACVTILLHMIIAFHLSLVSRSLYERNYRSVIAGGEYVGFVVFELRMI